MGVVMCYWALASETRKTRRKAIIFSAANLTLEQNAGGEALSDVDARLKEKEDGAGAGATKVVPELSTHPRILLEHHA